MKILNMKTWLLAGFCALSMLHACTDDKYATGLEIHPETELINIAHDSSKIVNAYTYESENFISVLSSQTNYILGYCNDPYLGEYTTNIISHITYSSATSNFKDSLESIEVISLMLNLDFDTSDGDTTELQNISIYEMQHNKELTDISGVELYDETLLGYYKTTPLVENFSFQPNKNWNTSHSSVVSIPITDEEFINRLWQDTVKYEDSDTLYNYRSDSLFKANVLNGLYFVSNPSNSKSTSVLKFGTTDSTGLVLKYKKIGVDSTGAEKIDTLSYNYSFQSQNKANLFYKNITNTIAYNKMYADEKVVSDTVVFIKNGNATYVRISVDNIGDWSDSVNMIINKASISLELNEDFDSTTMFNPTPSLYAYLEIGGVNGSTYPLAGHVDANGNYAAIPVRTLINGKNGYEIVVTNEVQQMKRNEEWNVPINIVVRSTSNVTSPHRVIINSSLNEDPMKFMLTYSKY